MKLDWYMQKLKKTTPKAEPKSLIEITFHLVKTFQHLLRKEATESNKNNSNKSSSKNNSTISISKHQKVSQKVIQRVIKKQH